MDSSNQDRIMRSLSLVVHQECVPDDDVFQTYQVHDVQVSQKLGEKNSFLIILNKLSVYTIENSPPRSKILSLTLELTNSKFRYVRN